MVDSSTTAELILDLSPGRRLARCQLHAGIRYVSGVSVFIEIAHPSGSGLLSLVSLNSMADSSTTVELILIPLLGRHWAQRQLHIGIKRLLRCKFSMELYGPGGGKRGGGFNQLYIRRREDY